MSTTSINVHTRGESVSLRIYHSNHGSRFSIETATEDITVFLDDEEAVKKVLNPLSWKITDAREDEDE